MHLSFQNNECHVKVCRSNLYVFGTPKTRAKALELLTHAILLNIIPLPILDKQPGCHSRYSLFF